MDAPEAGRRVSPSRCSGLCSPSRAWPIRPARVARRRVAAQPNAVCGYYLEWIHAWRFPLQPDPHASYSYAFIPWPARGDGAGHLNDGTLIVRNMLPAASFHHAIQDTTVPGDEQSVLGPYYPVGRYTTKSVFQKRGCA